MARVHNMASRLLLLILWIVFWVLVGISPWIFPWIVERFFRKDESLPAINPSGDTSIEEKK
ncbi:MAG: hypothetical protein CXX80_05480 [Methanobacteriota archaeon]|nr:MAG: hypothetical protein CXX80_05480 [Euryarchaeota archaeon]